MTVPAFAAQTAETQTESILLSPSSKRYDLDAGSTKRDSFTIRNDGQSSFTFTVYARPYSVKNELYEPDFVSKSNNADAYKWVQFDQSSYTAEPGQSIGVTYSIRVPKDAAPGGHYGVLFAETQPSGVAEGTAIIRKKRVGAIMYASINGDVKTSGKIESTNAPFFQFGAPLKIRSTVSNSGNTDFTVNGHVEVSDIFGGLKHTSDKESIILPGQPREIVNDWEWPAWIGLYKVEQTNKFLDTRRTSAAYVLLVPIWAYLLLALLILGRILHAIFLRRRKK